MRPHGWWHCGPRIGDDLLPSVERRLEQWPPPAGRRLPPRCCRVVTDGGKTTAWSANRRCLCRADCVFDCQTSPRDGEGGDRRRQSAGTGRSAATTCRRVAGRQLGGSGDASDELLDSDHDKRLSRAQRRAAEIH